MPETMPSPAKALYSRWCGLHEALAKEAGDQGKRRSVPLQKSWQSGSRVQRAHAQHAQSRSSKSNNGCSIAAGRSHRTAAEGKHLRTLRTGAVLQVYTRAQGSSDAQKVQMMREHRPEGYPGTPSPT